MKTCTGHVRNGVGPSCDCSSLAVVLVSLPIFNFRLVVLDKRWYLDGSMLESLKQICWEVLPSPSDPLILFTWSLSTDAYCILLSLICWKEWFLERLWVTFRTLVWTLGRGSFSFNFFFSVPLFCSLWWIISCAVKGNKNARLINLGTLNMRMSFRLYLFCYVYDNSF